MSTRRRSYVQRQLRTELRRFLAQTRALLAKTLLVTVTVCVAPVLMHSPAYVVGLTHGVMIVSVLAIVTAGFLVSGDVALLLVGSYAESFTREEIADAVRRGYAYNAVHDIELRRPDIDHLLLTPARPGRPRVQVALP